MNTKKLSERDMCTKFDVQKTFDVPNACVVRDLENQLYTT